MSSDLQPGQWYQASDGQWYCWPSPIPYVAPPVPATPKHPRGWIAPATAPPVRAGTAWVSTHQKATWAAAAVVTLFAIGAVTNAGDQGHRTVANDRPVAESPATPVYVVPSTEVAESVAPSPTRAATVRPSPTQAAKPAGVVAAPPVAKASPKPAPVVDVPVDSRAGCDDSYPDVCIPPAPPDLDCPQVPYDNFRVVGGDPHGFDGDNDGIGCET